MKLFSTLLLLVLLLVASASVASARFTPIPGAPACQTRWMTMNLDHFGFRTDTFKLRVLVYDKYYKKGSPIAFYTGNEETIDAFANWTGSVWEFGEKLNALLVFAEHRFYGKSQPCPGGFLQCGDYFSSKQALADYAHVAQELKSEYGTVGAILFGGSYGGMLAAIARMLYPKIFQGAIASSAPLGFWNKTQAGDTNPFAGGNGYWKVVTNTATQKGGGCASGCPANVHTSLTLALNMLSASPQSASTVAKIFKLCSIPTSKKDIQNFAYFVQAQYDTAAMGSALPFPSFFFAGKPGFPAPPYPMRAMCENIGKLSPTAFKSMSSIDQLTALYDSVSVLANLTDLKCYDIKETGKSVTSPAWNYQDCVENLFNEIPWMNSRGNFAQAGGDMFFETNVTRSDFISFCKANFNKVPRQDHPLLNTDLESVKISSNIFLYNGGQDPWSVGGYLFNHTDISPSVIAYVWKHGSHHSDLLPRDPAKDPAELVHIRQMQFEAIQKWLTEYKKSL